MRHPMTISTSARWARISATDHFSGAGRLRSLAVDTPLMRRANFLGVADWTLIGSCPSAFDRMRCVYCWGVSATVMLQPP